MADDALVQDVRAGLVAYGQRYGFPDSAPELEGIVGALLNVKTRGAGHPLTPQQIDAMVQAVKTGFSPSALGQAALNQAQDKLAEQAHQWQQEVEAQVRGIIDAYIQQYAPGATTASVEDLVTVVAPMVKDGQLNKPEVVGLAQTLTKTFVPDSTLARVLHPPTLSLAQDVAAVFSQKDTEAAVAETVTAYVDQFAPTVERIGEDLIENALEAIFRNRIQFGIDTALNLADRRLIIQQVSFKLNIMQQSPRPSKTAQQMAAELNTEIERFQAERRRQLGEGTATAGQLSRDGLSISSTWVFTDRGPSADATED